MPFVLCSGAGFAPVLRWPEEAAVEWVFVALMYKGQECLISVPILAPAKVVTGLQEQHTGS